MAKIGQRLCLLAWIFRSNVLYDYLNEKKREKKKKFDLIKFGRSGRFSMLHVGFTVYYLSVNVT